MRNWRVIQASFGFCICERDPSDQYFILVPAQQQGTHHTYQVAKLFPIIVFYPGKLIQYTALQQVTDSGPSMQQSGFPTVEVSISYHIHLYSDADFRTNWTTPTMRTWCTPRTC